MTLLQANGFVFLFALAAVNGYSFSAPDLVPVANAASGRMLDLRLDVGDKADSHMFIQGLVMELSAEDAVDKLRPMMPGADGPNSSVSAGAKSIVIKHEPYFIGMSGKETVPLRHGCWELVWREGGGAGVIVCGFQLEEAVKRNEATLAKGRIYMSLPVWIKQGLQEQQAYRRLVEARAEKYTREKMDAFRKMESTTDPMTKAQEFRNLAEATERLSYVPVQSVVQIPAPDDVMPLGKDLCLATKGTIWSKEESTSLFGRERVQHKLLGALSVRPGVINDSLKP